MRKMKPKNIKKGLAEGEKSWPTSATKIEGSEANV